MGKGAEVDPMQYLQAQYRESLLARWGLLNQLASRLRIDVEDVEAIARARESAHTLKGSGATYGFPDLSEVAKKTERAHANDFLEQLEHLIRTVEKTIEQCPDLQTLELESTESS